MSVRRAPSRWGRGDRLSASHLNEAVDAISDIQGRLEPSRSTTPGAEAVATDDDTDGLFITRVWQWVSSETRTERIESADDSSIYVDVLITRSVTVLMLDGNYVKIQLEDPANGE